MAQFDLDASKAIESISKLTSGIRQAGKELDHLTLSNTLEASFKKLDKTLETTEKALSKQGKTADEISRTMQTLKFTGEGAFVGIAAANQKANIILNAYAESQDSLNKVLRNTDSANLRIAATRTLNTLVEKASLDTTVLIGRMHSLATAEGKAAANTKVLHSAAEQLVTAETRLATEFTKVNKALELANTTQGKAVAATKVQLQSVNELSTANARLDASLARQAQQMNLLNDSKARSVTTNQILINALQQAAAAEAKLIAEEIALRKAAELTNTARFKTVEAMKQEAAERVRASRTKQEDLQYYAKKSAAVTKLARELRYLQTAEAQQAASLRAQISEQTRLLQSNSEAVARKTNQTRLAAQATAMLRASMAGMATSIGMYTSSTIIAASVTYGLARALRSGLEVGIEFTAAMARTNAIMSSSGGESLFSSLESQVRLLGQTTQFTVTQVAEAATELGQAGLSAGQSIVALQPALDLAIIGNLSMASSADHATNIMMIFGKEAADLSGIVDVLAMAVTNSNTNIDQLANALTYAGPAAHALGIDMKDTVAAIESLANSGFKASRAGTALRRLFVSLANPTKKGQAVLDQYNISVNNLQGEARSLTDILQQLNNAFEDLSGADRLTAIQNLVGVYATSPIAGLLAQTDNFVALRTQLELSAGAAEKMKSRIEDALQFDLREVKSAFEELQLSVFKNNETQLRVWAKEITEFIQHLGDAADGGATNLEKYAEKIKNYGLALGYIYAASKVIPMLRTFGAAAGANSVALNTSALATQRYGLAAAGLAMQMNMSSSAIVRNTGTVLANTAAVTLAAQRAGSAGLALGARVLGALTPVGTAAVVAFTAWQTMTAVFGKSDLPNSLQEQKDRVAELKTEYADLTEKAKEYQRIRTERNIAEQIDSLSENIDNAKARLRTETFLRDTLKAQGVDYSFIESKIVLTSKEIKDQVTTHNIISESLNKQKDLREKEKDLLDQINKLHSDGAFVMGDLTAFHQQINNLVKERLGITKQLTAEEAKTTVDSALAAGSNLAFGAYNEKISDLAQKNTPFSDRMKAAADDYSEARRTMLALEDAMKAVDASKATADTEALGQIQLLEDQYQRSATAVGKAALQMANLSEEYGKANRDLSQTWKTSDFESLSDSEKRVALLKEEVDLKARDAANRIKSESGQFIDAAEAKATADRLNEVRQALQGLNKERAVKVPRDKSLEDAVRASDALRQRYDAVGQSAKKMSDTEAQLSMLLKQGKLSTEDYAKALKLLAEDHQKVVLASDKHASAVNKIYDSYMKGDNAQRIQDIVALGEAFKNTNMSVEEHARLLEAIRKSSSIMQGSSVAGMPTISVPDREGPFSETLSAIGTHGEGMQQAADLQNKHDAEYSNYIMHLQKQHQAELDNNLLIEGGEEAHRQKMLEIQGRYEALGKAGFEQYSAESKRIKADMDNYSIQSTRLVMASMAGSLSDMLGMIASSAEDATGAQKAAFVAQKALAVVQILLNTEVAASLVGAQAGIAGIPLATLIRAQGYASAGMVAALAIGEISSGGTGSYAGAYDKGGYIPTGQYGIVGEYGPEIVNGPANVTGREATARKMAAGSGPQQVTIAPVIQIEMTSNDSGNSDQNKEDAKMMAETVKLIVIREIHNQLRPNGALYRG